MPPPEGAQLVPPPPPADAALPRTPTARVARIAGWGGGPPVPVRLWRPRDPGELAERLQALAAAGSPEGVIARGLGRAYGDAAQLSGGLVLQTGALRGFELDAERGILTAQAGISVAELLRELVPRGFVLPVMPGTQHVSVGGMVASDVHGKNHGEAGSFGRHVLELGLVSATGELVALAPGSEGFAATLGGMGLTGTIAWARVALARVAGPMMRVDTDRCETLEEVLAALRAPGGAHRVAWLDLLAGGGRVRGVVTRAQFAEADEQPQARSGDTQVPVRATVPGWWPGVLPRAGVRAFNELRFRTSPRRERDRLEPLAKHMFPLDRLGAWPRLYGPAGFVQYQLVVPFGCERVLEQVPAVLRAHDVPCFLAVLKDFGPATDASLSFPMPGWTLALDLPRSAPGLEPALERCDELVAHAGGRVYLSKDSRLRPESLAVMYPRLGEWREAKARLDPAGRWRSDLALRLELVDAPPGTRPASLAIGAGARPASLAIGAGGRPASEAAPAASRSARRPRHVLLLGGSSEIGTAIVRRMAAAGPLRVTLLGRSQERLRQAADELGAAGQIEVECAPLDALDGARVEPALDEAFARSGGFDVVVLAVGVLGAQEGLDADAALAREVLEVGGVGAGMLMLGALRRLRAQERGTLIALSSVAAERPRAGNAVYGAAKSAFDALAQGLSDSLAASRVEVIVVRPGFVHTKMTAGLEPAPFATSAQAVAEAAVAAIGSGSRTIWVPPLLRYVFAALRHLPRPIYRRLPL
jgi:decaprenylphospho-beta-D-ribofuranose 2-oxidase